MKYTPKIVVTKKPLILKRTIQPKQPINTARLSEIEKLRNIGCGLKLIILGNGPSLNKLDVEAIKQCDTVRTFGVNNQLEGLWPTHYWTVNDKQKLMELRCKYNEYNGTFISVLPSNRPNHITIKNVVKKWSTNLLDGIVLGRSSVFFSLQVAFWMNFDSIYVVGIDMNPNESGNLHFYGTNKLVDVNTRKKRFAGEAACYDEMLNVLDQSSKNKITLCVKDINPWSFATKLRNIHIESLSKEL